MIERIKLDDNQEKYVVDVGQNQVIVVLCLSDGAIVVRDPYNPDPSSFHARLQKYETWTSSSIPFAVQAQSPTGAEFLIVRYFR